MDGAIETLDQAADAWNALLMCGVDPRQPYEPVTPLAEMDADELQTLMNNEDDYAEHRNIAQIHATDAALLAMLNNDIAKFLQDLLALAESRLVIALALLLRVFVSTKLHDLDAFRPYMAMALPIIERGLNLPREEPNSLPTRLIACQVMGRCAILSEPIATSMQSHLRQLARQQHTEDLFVGAELLMCSNMYLLITDVDDAYLSGMIREVVAPLLENDCSPIMLRAFRALLELGSHYEQKPPASFTRLLKAKMLPVLTDLNKMTPEAVAEQEPAMLYQGIIQLAASAISALGQLVVDQSSLGRKYGAIMLPITFTIAENVELPDDIRAQAVTIIDSFLASIPSWLLEHQPLAINCIRTIWTCIKMDPTHSEASQGDLEAWEEEEPMTSRDEDDVTPGVMAEGSLDSFLSLFADHFMEPIFQILSQALTSPDWMERRTALIVLSIFAEHAHVVLNEFADTMAELLLARARDPHPRVRHGAFQALGQISSDAVDTRLFQVHSNSFLEACVQAFEADSSLRVRSHALSCAVNIMTSSTNLVEEAASAKCKELAHRIIQTLVPSLPTLPSLHMQMAALSAMAARTPFSLHGWFGFASRADVQSMLRHHGELTNDFAEDLLRAGLQALACPAHHLFQIGADQVLTYEALPYCELLVMGSINQVIDYSGSDVVKAGARIIHAVLEELPRVPSVLLEDISRLIVEAISNLNVRINEETVQVLNRCCQEANLHGEAHLGQSLGLEVCGNTLISILGDDEAEFGEEWLQAFGQLFLNLAKYAAENHDVLEKTCQVLGPLMGAIFENIQTGLQRIARNMGRKNNQAGGNNMDDNDDNEEEEEDDDDEWEDEDEDENEEGSDNEDEDDDTSMPDADVMSVLANTLISCEEAVVHLWIAAPGNDYIQACVGQIVSYWDENSPLCEHVYLCFLADLATHYERAAPICRDLLKQRQAHLVEGMNGDINLRIASTYAATQVVTNPDFRDSVEAILQLALPILELEVRPDDESSPMNSLCGNTVMLYAAYGKLFKPLDDWLPRVSRNLHLVTEEEEAGKLALLLAPIITDARADGAPLAQEAQIVEALSEMVQRVAKKSDPLKQAAIFTQGLSAVAMLQD
ncbi:uncharacterized protein MONBRDRAFT_35808 [Monosiga brevicollis MX1]|uniref:TOG domain-containing protein n=1 Tax=Monosiga brevicollis TaxID=81824 RepID=A9URY5_MONBE|nr:uncharacterized protein MONBRDRAFT_35808 [Monosiga brevicollis MX1]EDQ91686.1 predicted protein [Monosiga brevicollis MX1]|eukprot:XP_001742972.1 hypothetical protein [Monosiga brevicollis MX1]